MRPSFEARSRAANINIPIFRVHFFSGNTEFGKKQVVLLQDGSFKIFSVIDREDVGLMNAARKKCRARVH